MQIDGPQADAASARQRDYRPAPLGQQRTEYAKTGPHAVNKLRIGRDRRGINRVNVQRAIGMAFDFHAQMAQDQRLGVDVGDVGRAGKHDGLVSQNTGGHDWQGGIFGAGGGDGAAQWAATVDENCVRVIVVNHQCLPWQFRR